MRVSKITSQRTRFSKVARRQLTKVISEYGRDTCFVTLHDGSIQKLALGYVRYILLNQVGIRGDTRMKL